MSATANKASAILLSAGLGAIVVHTGMVKVKSPVPATLSSTASTASSRLAT